MLDVESQNSNLREIWDEAASKKGGNAARFHVRPLAGRREKQHE